MSQSEKRPQNNKQISANRNRGRKKVNHFKPFRNHLLYISLPNKRIFELIYLLAIDFYRFSLFICGIGRDFGTSFSMMLLVTLINIPIGIITFHSVNTKTMRKPLRSLPFWWYKATLRDFGIRVRRRRFLRAEKSRQRNLWEVKKALKPKEKIA